MAKGASVRRWPVVGRAFLRARMSPTLTALLSFAFVLMLVGTATYVAAIPGLAAESPLVRELFGRSAVAYGPEAPLAATGSERAIAGEVGEDGSFAANPNAAAGLIGDGADVSPGEAPGTAGSPQSSLSMGAAAAGPLHLARPTATAVPALLRKDPRRPSRMPPAPLSRRASPTHLETGRRGRGRTSLRAPMRALSRATRTAQAIPAQTRRGRTLAAHRATSRATRVPRPRCPPPREGPFPPIWSFAFAMRCAASTTFWTSTRSGCTPAPTITRGCA